MLATCVPGPNVDVQSAHLVNQSIPMASTFHNGCDFLPALVDHMKEHMHQQLKDALHFNLKQWDETIAKLHSQLHSELEIRMGTIPWTKHMSSQPISSADLDPRAAMHQDEIGVLGTRFGPDVSCRVPSRDSHEPSSDGMQSCASHSLSLPTSTTRAGTRDAQDQARRSAFSSIKMFTPLSVRGAQFVATASVEQHLQDMSCMQRVVDSSLFTQSTALLMVASSICLGIQVDMDNSGKHTWADTAQFIFTILFAVEIVMRFSADRVKFIYKDWLWSSMDVFVVFVALLENILSLFASTSKRLPNFSVYRFLRFIRLVRFMRVFRLEVFHELRMMLHSLCHCLKPLAWATLVLTIVTYTFAVIFTEETKVNLRGGHLAKGERQLLEQSFTSVRASFICLLESILGGTDWAQYAAALSRLSWVYELLFLVYIVVVNLGILNVVTSIFVDSSLRAAKSDRHIIIEAKLTERRMREAHLNELFHEMDTGNAGFICVKQLRDYLHDERVVALLRSLGVQYMNPDQFISALGLESDSDVGKISAVQFVETCFELMSICEHMLLDIHRQLLDIDKRLTK